MLPNFSEFVRLWSRYRSLLDHTLKVLDPLRGVSFRTIMFSYDRADNGWEAAEDLLAASPLSLSKFKRPLIHILHRMSYLLTYFSMPISNYMRETHAGKGALRGVRKQRPVTFQRRKYPTGTSF